MIKEKSDLASVEPSILVKKFYLNNIVYKKKKILASLLNEISVVTLDCQSQFWVVILVFCLSWNVW